MFFCQGSSEAPVLMFFCFLNEGWKDGNGKSAFLGDNFEVLDFTERIRKEPSRKVVEQFNISSPDTNLPWLRSRNPVKNARSVPSRKAATRKQCFWYVTFEAAINRMKTWKHGCKNGHFMGLTWLLNEFVCLNVWHVLWQPPDPKLRDWPPALIRPKAGPAARPPCPARCKRQRHWWRRVRRKMPLGWWRIQDWLDRGRHFEYQGLKQDIPNAPSPTLMINMNHACFCHRCRLLNSYILHSIA